MFAQISMWFVAAMLGQAPADPAWLNSVPSDVDIVVRGRSVNTLQQDVIAMLKAMSPGLAEQASPAIDQLKAQVRQTAGDELLNAGWAGLVRAVPGKPGGPPPITILIEGVDYAKLLKIAVDQHGIKAEPQPDGFDKLNAPGDDNALYGFKGAGFIAVGTDQETIASFARLKESNFPSRLTPTARKAFLDGDLGVYVNVAQLTTRYAPQMAQARQAMIGAFDANANANNGLAGPMVQFSKDFYGKIFDSSKDADVLTLNLDFDADGLALATLLGVKPDSALAKNIGSMQAGSPDFSSFSKDSALWMYSNMMPDELLRLQKLSFSMLASDFEKSPEFKAMEEGMRKLGRLKLLTAADYSDGMQSYSVVEVENPQAYVDWMLKMQKSMMGSDSIMNFYKDAKIEPNAHSYKGISYAGFTATIDQEKMQKAMGAKPEAMEGVSAMFKDGKFANWTGIAGGKVIQVMAPTWERAKDVIDANTNPEGGLAQSSAYKKVRARLTSEASKFIVLSAQGFTKLIVKQLQKTPNNQGIKVPDDLPAEPGLIGVSVTSRQPSAIEARLIFSSEAFPVFQKGLVPAFQALKPPQVNK